MLNLLPKDYKEKVRREYLRRFAIVFLIGMSVIDTFLLVSIFPVFTSVNLRKNIVEDASQSIKNSSKAKDRDVVLNNVKDLESRLKIASMVPGDKPTDYIDRALELKARGIYINNIIYTKKTETQKEVTIEGVASSRTNLIDFSKRIKASNWASTSDIPLSNLASDKNIQFFVTLTATSTPK